MGRNGVEAGRRPPVRRRWGLRALALLTLALAVVLKSSDGYTPLSALTVLLCLVAAAYCSVRGVRSFTWLPRR